jgi:hypothetical protein
MCCRLLASQVLCHEPVGLTLQHVAAQALNKGFVVWPAGARQAPCHVALGQRLVPSSAAASAVPRRSGRTLGELTALIKNNMRNSKYIDQHVVHVGGDM